MVLGLAVHSESSNEPYLSRVADWQVLPTSTTGMTDTAIVQRDLSKTTNPDLGATGSAVIDASDGVATLDGTNAGLEVTGPVVDGTAPFTAMVDLDPNVAAMASSSRTDFRLMGQRGAGSVDSSWAAWFHKTGSGADPSGATYVQGYLEFGTWSSPSSGVTTGAETTDALRTLGGDTGEGEMHVTVAYRPHVEELPEASDMEIALYDGGVNGLLGVEPFSAPVQGAGSLAVGKGWKSGLYTDWLPADVQEVALFAGGAVDDEISTVDAWAADQ
jgi:hypothetical protein